VKNPWKPEEQRLFEEGLAVHGHKKMKEIADYIGTRTVVQVRSHM
jgi:hypothetical protein